MKSLKPTTPPTRPRLPTLRELIETEEKVREILRARMRRTAPTPEAGSMSPNLKSENLTVLDTGHIDGGAYRWLELADGSWRVEEWRGDKWVPGGASFGEFFDSPPVSPGFASELGIPMADIRVVRRPTTTPPRLRMPPLYDTSTGAKLVDLLKERAWDLAASSVPPGHA
jgi:hypothetical protein